MVSLGIDTSNYTTSAAIYDSETGAYDSERELLPVPPNALGLRQSDAVFQHTVKLPVILEALFRRNDLRPDVISVSVRPSDSEGSYMPCFLTGQGAARAISAAMDIPVYSFSHQAGHIAAVLLSDGQTELCNDPFYAFHLSGGTTDALFVTPDAENIFHVSRLGGSLDLKAGQAIDRVGKMLGLPFPAGKALDELSCKSKNKFYCKPFFKDVSCSFSGLENQCEKMLRNGELPEDIAKYCMTYICTAVEELTNRLIREDASLPIVYSGGVSGNSLLRQQISTKYRAIFAQHGLASDNAAGVAWLGAEAAKRKRNTL